MTGRRSGILSREGRSRACCAAAAARACLCSEREGLQTIAIFLQTIAKKNSRKPHDDALSPISSIKSSARPDMSMDTHVSDTVQSILELAVSDVCGIEAEIVVTSPEVFDRSWPI